MFVAGLSLSTIIRVATARRGSATPAENSLPLMPGAAAFFSGGIVSGSGPLGLPAGGWLGAGDRDGRLFVLGADRERLGPLGLPGGDLVGDGAQDRQLDCARGAHRFGLADADRRAGVEILRVEGDGAREAGDAGADRFVQRLGGGGGGQK